MDTNPEAAESYDPRKQGGQFDKIVKENIIGSLAVLLQQLLGISFSSFTIESPDIQVTLERKTDVVLLIRETPTSAPYLLHLEFQSRNSARMAKRMLLYYAILFMRYDMPIKQAVIYLGDAPVNMPNAIYDKGRLDYSFPIYDVRQLPAKAFLQAQAPEAVVFAILADYGDLAPEALLRALIQRLKELETDPIRLEEYILQVGVLAQLRSLETVFTETIDTMPVEIDEDRVPFVVEARRKGVAEGEVKGKALGITTAFEIQERLRAGEDDLEALAQEFDVTVEQVRYIQQRSQL